MTNPFPSEQGGIGYLQKILGESEGGLPLPLPDDSIPLSAIAGLALDGIVVDAIISESTVTQHEGALSIKESQIVDGDILARLKDDETIEGLWSFEHALGFKTDIISERTAGIGVTVDGLLIKDAGIPESAVTDHEAALTILESQITDANILARIAGTEIITGLYTFRRNTPALTDPIIIWQNLDDTPAILHTILQRYQFSTTAPATVTAAEWVFSKIAEWDAVAANQNTQASLYLRGGASGLVEVLKLLGNDKSVEMFGELTIPGLVVGTDPGTANEVRLGGVKMQMVLAGDTPRLTFHRAQGTLGSPTAVTTNTSLGSISFGGYTGSGYSLGAAYIARASENWTPTDRGAHFRIQTTPSGTTNLTGIWEFQDVGHLIPLADYDLGGSSNFVRDLYVQRLHHVAETETITGAVADGHAASLRLDPAYTSTIAAIVDRHNFIEYQNPSGEGVGPASITDAPIAEFDAAAGVHKSLTAQAVKINVDSTLGYMPFYFVGGPLVLPIPLSITERAAAVASVAGNGVYWVKDDAPNRPYFTDDSDIDYQIGLATYAEIYASDVADTIVIAVAGQANKVQITSFATDGLSEGMTPDHTNDHITVDRAGDYLVTCSLAVESVGGAAEAFGFAVYKNNGATEFTNLHAHRDLAAGGGDIGSISISGIVALVVNDTVEVWVWNEDGTNNIVVDDITLSLMRVGD